MRTLVAVLGVIMFAAGAYSCDTCGCKAKKADGKTCKTSSAGCKGGGCKMMCSMKKLKLTDEQQKKIEVIKAECKKKILQVLTEEQRKTMKTACAKKGSCGTKADAKKGCCPTKDAGAKNGKTAKKGCCPGHK